MNYVACRTLLSLPLLPSVFKRVSQPFLHINVCSRALGNTSAYVKQGGIKHSVAPEEAAPNLINVTQ